MLGDPFLCKCENKKCDCKKRNYTLMMPNPAQKLAFFYGCMGRK
jgi:hypothetical protein